MTEQLELILASGSPRRKQLLSLGGWSFRVMAAEVDESPIPGEIPSAYVLRLAQEKAQVVARLANDSTLILAADTSVVDGQQILGKPVDSEEAVTMLQQLRDREHRVLTAIAVLQVGDGKMVTDLSITKVPMRNYTDQEITTYVASGDPLDKAGGYAIQNMAFRPVRQLQGCFANVMGLPLCHLVRTLKRLNLPTPDDVPGSCQAALQYRCPVYQRVLEGLA